MSFTVSNLKYIDPPALRSWFLSSKSPTGDGKFIIIDVRDGDYIGGHIKNGLHYPSASLESKLPELIQKLKTGGYNDVVFHCMLSQQRGPSLAMRLMRLLDDKDFDPHFCQIWILRGGFTKWQELYGKDELVTEAYAQDIWNLY